jgi:hypothetical protein
MRGGSRPRSKSEGGAKSVLCYGEYVVLPGVHHVSVHHVSVHNVSVSAPFATRVHLRVAKGAKGALEGGKGCT